MSEFKFKFRREKYGKGWKKFFKKVVEEEISNICDVCNDLQEQDCVIYPRKENIFRAFSETHLENLKVVIIGQDPYHNEGAAMGVAFGHENYGKIQPSLRNIIKELKSDGYKAENFSGDLTNWCSQGVFLINTALTVEKSKPNSHKKIWKDFTQKLFEYISLNTEGLVVIAWGTEAQKHAKIFDNDKHHIIISPHPSPFSASKGFFGSKPFSKTNKILKNNGFEEINWNL